MTTHPDIVEKLRPGATLALIDQLRAIARKQMTPALRETLDCLLGDAVTTCLFTPSTRIKDAHAKVRLVQAMIEDPNLHDIVGVSKRLPSILVDIADELRRLGEQA